MPKPFVPFVQPNQSTEERFLNAFPADFPGHLSLSQQMQILSEQTSLTAVDYHERIELCTLIKRRLLYYFPNCQVLLYGSTVNGLGFKGCDVDMLFLPYPNYSNTPDDPQEKKSVRVKMSDVKYGKISRSVLMNLDEVSLLHFVKQELYRLHQLNKVIFIPAKHPILNFVKSGSLLTCDLSASNRLVCHNSELLNLFLKMDGRVKPLVMCLRFWAKKLKFIKKGEFSSYAFTLMVIFFLQNTEPPILPSVKHLSDISGYSRKIDGWECSFTEDLNAISPSQNMESVDFLLMKFFHFYWQFDFTRNVISTYCGSIIPLKELINSDDERFKDFKVSPICVQDPFILSRNVSTIINHYSTHSFKLTVFELYNMLNKESSKLQLTDLFNVNRFEYSKDLSDEKRLILIRSTFNIAQLFENEYEWYHEISWGIYKILHFVLLFECEIIDMNSKMPNSSFEEEMSANSDNLMKVAKFMPVLKNNSVFLSNELGELELLMSIQCTTYYRTWFNRKHVSEIDTNDVCNPVLRRERSISDIIVGGNPLLNCSEPLFWFCCDIYKYKMNELSDIVVMFEPLQPSKELCSVFTFLHSYIPKTVISYLKVSRS